MFQRSEHRKGFEGGPLERVNLGRHLIFVRPEGVRGTDLRNRTTMIISRIADLRRDGGMPGIEVKQSLRMPCVAVALAKATGYVSSARTRIFFWKAFTPRHALARCWCR